MVLVILWFCWPCGFWVGTRSLVGIRQNSCGIWCIRGFTRMNFPGINAFWCFDFVSYLFGPEISVFGCYGIWLLVTVVWVLWPPDRGFGVGIRQKFCWNRCLGWIFLLWWSFLKFWWFVFCYAWLRLVWWFWCFQVLGFGVLLFWIWIFGLFGFDVSWASCDFEHIWGFYCSRGGFSGTSGFSDLILFFTWSVGFVYLLFSRFWVWGILFLWLLLWGVYL